ncbi:MAG TPA: pyridoxamine 5'-phosphate oxidase [Gammaproteobacteria bacterium]|nr:pyridoxamine 5'-phosphate oxidase [Gammaproteobacteria bacterium]
MHNRTYELQMSLELMDIGENNLPDTPLPLFSNWYAAACQNPLHDPSAMTLATSDTNGRVAARVVLLKEHGPDGFVFYTNYHSRKADDLIANNQAALVFWWPWLGQQVRVEGRVEKDSPRAADTYFASRPRDSQIGAWASQQSEQLPTREHLQQQFAHYTEKFAGQTVPRPPHWGGYCLNPQRLEFWHDQQGRLHDRIVYCLNSDAGWDIQRLNP